MRIERDQIVGGLPARDVRRFMRSAAGTIIRPRTAVQICGLSTRKAEEFLHELEHEGLISPKEDYWEATAKGHAFAMATAAKPLRKFTAERLLTEIIHRAQVHQLVLFGSVMKGADRPNDVDIGCTLVPRFEGERQRVLEDERRTKKTRFANTSEWAVWPKFDVLKRLKSRSGGCQSRKSVIGPSNPRITALSSLPHPNGIPGAAVLAVPNATTRRSPAALS